MSRSRKNQSPSRGGLQSPDADGHAGIHQPVILVLPFSMLCRRQKLSPPGLDDVGLIGDAIQQRLALASIGDHLVLEL